LHEPELYECAITGGEAKLTSGGALCAETGVHTGRSPKDKYIVCDDLTNETVWWENSGKMTPAQFALLHHDFIAHSAGKTLHVQDLRAGADAEVGLRTRVFTTLAWHSLFIRTLLLRPDRNELATFVPELTIYCCPTFRADPKRHGVRGETVIAIDFSQKIILIGGEFVRRRDQEGRLYDDELLPSSQSRFADALLCERGFAMRRGDLLWSIRDGENYPVCRPRADAGRGDETPLDLLVECRNMRRQQTM
jgi:ATP-dependent phosphoenolpyruvate carboxykinase